jgi:DNA-binding transcriptional MerR regulator
MDGKDLRVGEMAKRTGLTVRALHHWDQVGLLSPLRRTAAGHRLYGSSEVRRLQRILSLKALGLTLDEIGSLLRDRAPSLEVVLRTHRDRVRDQLHLLQELEGRLDRILVLLAGGNVIAEAELLKTMEKMAMIEKHFSPEQLEALNKRQETLGPEAIRAAQEEWPRLIASVQGEMEKGTDPGSEEVQALAMRWRNLIQAFSGGDSQIEASVAGMYKAEPDMAAQQGLDPALFNYIGAAMRAGTDKG